MSDGDGADLIPPTPHIDNPGLDRGAGDVDERLEPFRRLNRRRGETPARERVNTWRLQFPNTQLPDREWAELMLRDNEGSGIFALLRSVMREDARIRRPDTASRPGPMDVGDQTAESEARLRQLLGEDWSYQPFHVAFAALARWQQPARRATRGGPTGISTIAAKIGLPRTTTWELLRGSRTPTNTQIEAVAAAYKKYPAYFVEWRNRHLVGVLALQLDRSPETSVDLYKEQRSRRRA